MLKVYFTHRISGGLEDSIEAFKVNCEAAQMMAMNINWKIKSLDIYVPGGPSEEFVGKCYQLGLLTVDQILAVDCDILATKDIVLCWVPEGDELQGGRKVEVNYARAHDKPVIIFATLDEAVTKLNSYMAGYE